MDTGNTALQDMEVRMAAVQPRGYGEHSKGEAQPLTINGSAPWIRGTLLRGQVKSTLGRFSPVDTGNTYIAH